MNSAFHVPSLEVNRTYFTVSGSDWQPWEKPSGCRRVMITCFGAGAAGSTPSAGDAQVGGNGGGSGGYARLFVNADLIPDVLWVQVGVATTSVGARSFVGIQPTTTATDLLLMSGNAAATGTTAETIGSAANCTWSQLGIVLWLAGNAGSVGGSGGTGGVGVASVAANQVTMGGAGGAGIISGGQAAGGAITGAGSLMPATVLAGGLAGGGNGGSGYFMRDLFMWFGGAGGGSNNTGNGGAGGVGAMGCGGGGGGGSLSGSVGAGGIGGNGLVVIGVV